MKARFKTGLVVNVLFCIAGTAYAESRDYLIFSAGAYEAVEPDRRTVEGRVEYRKDIDFFLKPLVGGLISGNRALYGYVGVYHDFYAWEKYFVTPSFAVGLYDKGNGQDLNYPIEFKSQIEIGYEFYNHYRASAGFSHISNASLSHTRNKSNPGEESIFLSFHLPM